MFLIQQSVVKESVHKIISGETFKDLRAQTIDLINLAKRRAPNSSRRGVVCFFIGATRVLEDTRLTSTSPFSCSVRKYTTAAKALSDASQKPWKLVRTRVVSLNLKVTSRNINMVYCAKFFYKLIPFVRLVAIRSRTYDELECHFRSLKPPVFIMCCDVW